MMVKPLPLNALLTKVARHQLVMTLARTGSNPAPATNSLCFALPP